MCNSNTTSYYGVSKNYFANLKQKYSKKKSDLKKAKRWVTALVGIQCFEKQLEDFSLLDWLNHVLKLRKVTRSNLKDDDDNINNSS